MDKFFTQKNLIEKLDSELEHLIEESALPSNCKNIDAFEIPGDNCISNILAYSKALSVRNSEVMDKISFVLN